MKLEFKELVKREVEVELPAFMKSNCHFYKVITEEYVICVADLDGHYGIRQSCVSLAFADGNKPSNEQEFNDAFKLVLTKLTINEEIN